tara:strand:+ start:580 stop:795 length:216 start_codon:yes stop_codon:yes gene_type:complete
MIVKQILNDEKKPLLHIADVSGSALVCRIELTHKEAEAIMYSLMTTHCSGEQLTVSIELEDKLLEVVKHCR